MQFFTYNSLPSSTVKTLKITSKEEKKKKRKKKGTKGKRQAERKVKFIRELLDFCNLSSNMYVAMAVHCGGRKGVHHLLHCRVVAAAFC